MLKKLQPRIAAMKPGKIGRQASLVVIGDAINFSTGLVSSMILARLIPLDMMGTYRQIMYLTPMAVSITELGISSTVYRFWNFYDNQKRAQYARILTVITFVLGLVASAGLALLAPFLAEWFGNPALKSALLITAAYPLSNIPLMLLRPVLLCKGYSLKATLLETMFSLLSILSILTPLLLGFSLITALAVWITVSLLRLVAFPLILREHLFLQGDWWDRSIVRDLWEYIWPIQVGRLPGYIITYLDKVVTSLFFTTTEFAVYSMGAREIPFIGYIGFSVSNVLLPYLVEDIKQQRFEQAFARWRKACERTALVTYPIAAFCCWYAVPVMQFMFSATYTDSSIPFRVFAALTFVRVIEYSSLAKALGRTDLIMRLSFVNAAVLIILIFPLGWILKGFGIALSLLVAIVSSFAYVLLAYRKLLRVGVRNFFPWPRLAVLLSISLGSAGISSLCTPWLFTLNADAGILRLGCNLAGLFAIELAVYGALLLATGFLKIPQKKS